LGSAKETTFGALNWMKYMPLGPCKGENQSVGQATYWVIYVEPTIQLLVSIYSAI
jgi:hypothetical protein